MPINLLYYYNAGPVALAQYSWRWSLDSEQTGNVFLLVFEKKMRKYC